MLFTTIFSFPHNIFKSLHLRVVESQDYVIKGHREYIYSVAVHQKYLTKRNDNF